MEYSRAVTSNDFGKCRLVFPARLARQLEVGRSFITVRQKRSSIEIGGQLCAVRLFRWGTLLVIALFTGATAFTPMAFELRFHLFKLGLLLSGQNGLHFLTKLESFTHQLRLQARHFRQFLSSQRFIERTAFARLAQLLPLRSKLLHQ